MEFLATEEMRTLKIRVPVRRSESPVRRSESPVHRSKSPCVAPRLRPSLRVPRASLRVPRPLPRVPSLRASLRRSKSPAVALIPPSVAPSPPSVALHEQWGVPGLSLAPARLIWGVTDETASTPSAQCEEGRCGGHAGCSMWGKTVRGSPPVGEAMKPHGGVE